jgi:hypothetical protein
MVPTSWFNIDDYSQVMTWKINSDGSVDVFKAGVVASCPCTASGAVGVKATSLFAVIPQQTTGMPRPANNIDLSSWLASFRPGADKYAIVLIKEGTYSKQAYYSGILVERVYRGTAREFVNFGVFGIARGPEEAKRDEAGAYREGEYNLAWPAWIVCTELNLKIL